MKNEKKEYYLLEHRMAQNDDDSLKIIGVFSSVGAVQKVIEHFRTSVVGFQDFPDGFRVFLYHLKVNEKISVPSTVFLLVSWKQNGNEEKNIQFEGLFLNRYQAIQLQIRNKIVHPLRKSIVERFKLDQPEWQEGFRII